MNKSQIIEAIYLDKSYINICKQICSTGNYYDYSDLFQEVILILLEKPDQEILTAYEAKFIKFLFVRISNNQYRSKTSYFHKKYRGLLKTTELTDFECEDEKNLSEEGFNDLIQNITTHLNTLNDYDKNLFGVWLNLGLSSAEVSRATGIDQQNVSKKILKIRKELAEKYGTDYFNIFD